MIVGGGFHHDFNRWFDQKEQYNISESGAEITYTDDPDAILPRLPGLDIFYLSNNQPLHDPKLRSRIFEFVESGNGLLLVHPAIWYNWSDWPEYNRELAGGGSRSQPPFGDFEVMVTAPDHPVMASVAERFTIKDELYRFERDEKSWSG